MEIEIPEWNRRWGSDESFGISPSDLPPSISRQLEPGMILVGAVNLNIRDLNDLVIEDIKIQEKHVYNYKISNIEEEDDDFEDIDDIIKEYESENLAEESEDKSFSQDEEDGKHTEIAEIEEIKKEMA